jgi:phage terminase small subunit
MKRSSAIPLLLAAAIVAADASPQAQAPASARTEAPVTLRLRIVRQQFRRNPDPQTAARVSADLKRLAGELGLEATSASRVPTGTPGAPPDAA